MWVAGNGFRLVPRPVTPLLGYLWISEAEIRINGIKPLFEMLVVMHIPQPQALVLGVLQGAKNPMAARNTELDSDGARSSCHIGAAIYLPCGLLAVGIAALAWRYSKSTGEKATGEHELQLRSVFVKGRCLAQAKCYLHTNAKYPQVHVPARPNAKNSMRYTQC